MKSFKQHLDEISKKTLGSYVNKAADSAALHHGKYEVKRAHEDEVDRFTNRIGAGNQSQLRDKMKTHMGVDTDAQRKDRNVVVKRLRGIEKAVTRLTKEETDRPFDYAHFHENAYHHHMERHAHHWDQGEFEEGEKHGWAAEHHAAEYHKHTNKKLYDPGYGGNSPHVTSHE